MLSLTGLAIDHRNAVRLRRRTHPAREPAREPHQVRVIQPLITIAVLTPPPRPEAPGECPREKYALRTIRSTQS
jgi:hypothetical protein